MLVLLAAIILFHLSIVLKLVPYEITWGGRLKSDAEMYAFETISIAINLMLILILLIKRKFVRELIPMKFVNLILWIFVGLFALNTVGNVLAKSNFEKLFALLTSAFAILIWKVLRGDKQSFVK